MKQRVTTTRDWYHRTTAGRPRIEPLTGLRWCAAFAVCLSHNVPKGKTPLAISTFFSSGYMGVTVFFVLSGFVLTVTYGSALARPNQVNTWNYVVARMARVVPLYLLVLVFVVSIGINQISISKVWWHIFAVQAWSGDLKIAYGWNGPGWSVGVEFFLYAMFPLLILLTRFLSSTKRVMFVAMTVVGVMLVLIILFHITGYDQLPRTDAASAHRWLYRSPVARLGDFILGICGAMIYARERERVSLVRSAPFVATAMSLLILALMMVPSLLATSPTYDVAYAVPSAVLILALALSPDKGIAKLLGSMIFVLLGELSYAFYLIHQPVGIFILGTNFTNGFTAASTAIFIMDMLILIAISWVLHVSFERPVRVYLRKHLSISRPRKNAPSSETATEG